MRKTIVLLTIVLAILAAPVFAEVTASGSVEFGFAYNADNYSEYADNEVDVNLGATVGEYTSIDANLSAAEDTSALDQVVYLDSMTLTQDITGALGMDAGFGLSATFGISSFEPMEYQAVAGYGDFEYDDDSSELTTYNLIEGDTIMSMASISLEDMVTIDVAVYEPGAEVMSDAMQFGINAYGTFGMVDASVSYLKIADKTSIFGLNAAAMPMEDLTVGAGVSSYNYDGDSITGFGVSASYTMDALTAGFAMTSATTSLDTDEEFGDVTNYAVNVNYMVSEAATVFAGVMIAGDGDGNVDTDLADTLGYEVGASYVLDGVTYSAGYTFDSDYTAVNGEFMDGADRAGNVFLKISASF
ncbi:hypothetical protein EXM22_10675 [Oceanispirochaeta crateris]|uniref:Porin domain-containing protein n=1 Tax=Oceanispirochaeta crateris TaxID=2518645 RepID=A0A5C1QJX3_9SPIO|nr:porin [Oceanispirochaeta crateris]QEN08425.1 hypothetical protein EXM22_10675 [Oceanispirochaeta crateris]